MYFNLYGCKVFINKFKFNTTEFISTVSYMLNESNNVSMENRANRPGIIIPEPTVRSAVPGVSPGRGLLIPL